MLQVDFVFNYFFSFVGLPIFFNFRKKNLELIFERHMMLKYGLKIHLNITWKTFQKKFYLLYFVYNQFLLKWEDTLLTNIYKSLKRLTNV